MMPKPFHLTQIFYLNSGHLFYFLRANITLVRVKLNSYILNKIFCLNLVSRINVVGEETSLNVTSTKNKLIINKVNL